MLLRDRNDRPFSAAHVLAALVIVALVWLVVRYGS